MEVRILAVGDVCGEPGMSFLSNRLKEYIMVNPKATVAAIREATALLLEDGKLNLIGKPNKMKVFKTKMENTKEFGLRSDINFLLKA